MSETSTSRRPTALNKHLPMIKHLPFDIQSLHAAYRDGLSLHDVVAEVFRRIDAVNDAGIFIQLQDRELVSEVEAQLGQFDPEQMPLWGIPFAVKDNIDVAGMETTAACPAFAYAAQQHAFCVTRLLAAGAILIGKTNMDQFATGLVGVRTPYPVPKNAIDPALVPGGSSSGSATAVAHGIVSFALGTDTAGSGRVPAGLNNIVGLKPTLGTVSKSGVVPACKTLDTISIFAVSVGDATSVFQEINCPDDADPYARRYPARPIGPAPTHSRVGVPDDDTRQFFGDTTQAQSFEDSLTRLEEFGAELVPIDFRPFYEVADLLYAGAWVAERNTVLETWLQSKPEAVHPITRQVVKVADQFSATDAFRHFYRAAELKAEISRVLNQVDFLCVPTTPTIYTVDDLDADPIQPNSRLGTYTNFVNILDLCALTIPTQKRQDGWPGSVTLIGPAGHDGELADIGHLLHETSHVRAGATTWPVAKTQPIAVASSNEIALAVVGAHMTGLPLNHELTRLDARFLERTQTAPTYQLYSLAGGPPYRPGLIRDENGQAIEIEIWALPKERFGAFIDGVPQPLGIGSLDLADGRRIKGFICETAGLSGAENITAYGGWRNYMAALS